MTWSRVTDPSPQGDGGLLAPPPIRAGVSRARIACARPILGNAVHGIGSIGHAVAQLLRRQPLRKEIGGHVRVVYFVDGDLAVADALLKGGVASEKVAGAGR